MPPMHGLRHFSRGVSQVSQWTGREVKEMSRVLLGAVCGLDMPPGKTVKGCQALSSFLSFIYLSHQANISDTGISAMKQALTTFHEYKDIFLGDNKLCQGFNGIPKFHVVQHYPYSITEFGTCDGYSTEHSERLHIDFAKEGYRASNRVNPIPQMTRYLERQDAMHFHAEYLRWRTKDTLSFSDSESDTESEESDSDFDTDRNCEKNGLRGNGDNENNAGRCSERRRFLQGEFHSILYDSNDGFAYPQPKIQLTKSPSTRQTIDWVSANHGAENLCAAIKAFCISKNPRETDIQIRPTELLNVWNRIRLYHDIAPMNATSGKTFETLRTLIPKRKPDSGDIIKDGIFDTALVLNDPNESGFKR
jgi:hypothetical protein